MRSLMVLGAACVAGTALADREITVPKGHRLLDSMFRAEILGIPGENSTRAWFGTGFNRVFDGEFTLSQEGSTEWVSSFDLSYNYSPPITDIAPGVSVGVQDGMNVTDVGRAFYLAATFRYGNVGDLNQDVPTEVTLGFWTRKTGLTFVAVSLPISDKLFLVGEHDSQRLTGGIEVRPFSGLVLKSIFEKGATSYGLALTRRF